MERKLRTIISFTASAVILLAACKKDSIPQPKPQPDSPNQQQAQQLTIILNNNYLTAAKLDSALAIWEVNGTTQKVKLQATNNTLATSLASFDNNGTGKLSIQLFTQTKIDGIPLQWEHRSNYTLNRTKALQIAAPTDIKDPVWSPRLIYNSEIHDAEFLALIALRPEDTYFELKGVQPNIAKRIEVVRSFFNNDTTKLVASRGWIGAAKDLDAKGNLVNRDHFRALDEQLDGRPWNIVKVRASFYANLTPNEIYEAETEHDRP